jgi:16S rRNA (adenine1518-N6/adenine1519-N6)-dimethyltransferase
MTVRAKKELGQHFLVDENILGVIGRLAELHDDDVVLEIGPGLGILTRYLSDQVRQVYAVELDRSLESELHERLGDRRNVDLQFGDALRVDLAEAAPGATKLVANLPYNVATPLIVESLDGLPEITLWCVMVQREVADRLFATPSTKAYGAVSVLVQLVTERTGFHRVSRSVFRPRPKVESALVAFRRTGLPPGFQRVKDVVEASFAHRRKRLPNSLELSGLSDRGRAEAALAELGKPAAVRAQELQPAEFLRLAQVLA